MMKKILALTFVLMLCIAGTTFAAPISLPSDTPIYFQFNDLEQVSINNDIVVPGINSGLPQGNWGVAKLSTIQLGQTIAFPPHNDISGGGLPYPFTDGVTGQITAVFYGINLTSGTTATGGIIDLYWNDVGSNTVGNVNDANYGPDAATVALFTSGTFLARLDYAPGIIQGDNVTTIQSDQQPANSSSNGHADGFLNVDLGVVGPWTDVLNGDWFWVDTDGDGVFGEPGETRDVRLGNTFNGLGDASDWATALDENGDPIDVVGLRSNDPGRAFNATTIPEPGTIVLLGLGLFGLGFFRRRK